MAPDATGLTATARTARSGGRRGCPARRRDRAVTRGRRVALLGAALTLVAAAGCAGDGRTLRAPSPDQTTTASDRPDPPALVGGGSGGNSAAAGNPLRLTSGGFAEGEALPDTHTCRGAGSAPSLSWTGVPADTAELAVIVRDRVANGAVHWAVAGIPATAAGVADILPAGAVEATNDFGTAGWAPPCPEDGTHHYDITLYAMPQPLGIEAGAPSSEAVAAIESAPATLAALSATVAPVG